MLKAAGVCLIGPHSGTSVPPLLCCSLCLTAIKGESVSTSGSITSTRQRDAANVTTAVAYVHSGPGESPETSRKLLKTQQQNTV